MTIKAKIGIIAGILICIGLISWIGRPPSGPANAKEQKPIILPDNVKLLESNWPALAANTVGGPFGNPNAPWTVIEFGDFQCPQCGKAHAFAERMVQKSRGQVKMYFFNFPLKMHANAHSAALAGLAAANQGKFWPLYDAMYSNQDGLSRAGIMGLASGIKGLDMKKFVADWDNPATAATLASEVALGTKVDIEITPSFMLRKSKGGDVTRYIGTLGQKIEPIIPGLIDLMQSDPWNVEYDPEDMPDPTSEH